MSLIRNSGRIGTNGKTMVQTFDGNVDAVEAFGRLERATRRRGYAAVDEKPSQSGNFWVITAPPAMPALSVPQP
jgi:predicted DNA-binding WGR domain protein